MSDDKKALTTIQGVTLYGGPTAEEPTVYDLDLARWAGLKSPRDIRRTISKLVERGDLTSNQFLNIVDADDLNVGGAHIQTGNATKHAYLLTEAGALNVLVTLRTKAAVAARQQIIAVYVAWRRGVLPTFAEVQAKVPTLAEQAEYRFEIAKMEADYLSFIEQKWPTLDPRWLQERKLDSISKALNIEFKVAEGKRSIDISTYLKSKGLPQSVVKKERVLFGKYAKAVYTQVKGEEPREVPRLLETGVTVAVASYAEEDLPILDAAYEAWTRDNRLSS